MKLLLDLARNAIELRLTDAEPAGAWRSCPATIDVGESGRLLGVELALRDAGEPHYLPVEEPNGELVRSAAAQVRIAVDDGGELVAVELPRRGDGYELSYPSGNQCWLPSRTGGRLVCDLS
jgi:hypothetical protein